MAPQKLWDSGIGLSAWLVRLLVTTDRGAAAVAAVSASESESHPASGDVGPGIVVQELRERLALREECHVIELGAPFSPCSVLVSFCQVPSSRTVHDRCRDWGSLDSPCRVALG
jgi:hypothetical protein